jgi:putative flippase GtrA
MLCKANNLHTIFATLLFMRSIHNTIRKIILAIVDFFYPLFKKIMPIQTFRYAVCGGANTVLGIVLYFIAFHYIFTDNTVQLTDKIALKRHIAADYLFAFWVAFPIGFYLNRYVVFQESNLKKRVQLFRYFVVLCGSIAINYFCLKLFVEIFHIHGPTAKVITSVVVIAFSYISQRNYSFKTIKEDFD